jgi:hypothetical protein
LYLFFIYWWREGDVAAYVVEEGREI